MSQPFALKGPLSAYSADGKAQLIIQSDPADSNLASINYYKTGQIKPIRFGSDLQYVLADGGTSYQSLRGKFSAVDSQVSTHGGLISTLNTQVPTEIADRGAADTALGLRIDGEITARTAADTTLTTNLNTEIADRKAADTALGGRIDTLTSGSSTAVADEKARALAAEGVLTTNLSTELKARGDADTALGLRIDGEITARTAADTAEAKARGDMDVSLNAAITLEQNTRAAAITAAEAARATLAARVLYIEQFIQSLQDISPGA